jgi:hypothetical protein
MEEITEKSARTHTPRPQIDDDGRWRRWKGEDGRI